MKSGLPAGWEGCPVWRAWVCGDHAAVLDPEGIRRTTVFLGEFCRSTGGCGVHPVKGDAGEL